MDRPNAGRCPPHHWAVTTARIGDETFYHHTCIRCDAQKDTPLYVTTTSWRPERFRGLAVARGLREEPGKE